MNSAAYVRVVQGKDGGGSARRRVLFMSLSAWGLKSGKRYHSLSQCLDVLATKLPAPFSRFHEREQWVGRMGGTHDDTASPSAHSPAGDVPVLFLAPLVTRYSNKERTWLSIAISSLLAHVPVLYLQYVRLVTCLMQLYFLMISVLFEEAAHSFVCSLTYLFIDRFYRWEYRPAILIRLCSVWTTTLSIQSSGRW